MELTEEQKRAVRIAARERKRKQRERDKKKRIRALEQQRVAALRAERSRRHLHFYGEASPGRNATTFEDELAAHREFLRTLNQPDVQPGETLRSVARRTFHAWVSGPFASRDQGSIYVPGFNRAAQAFDSEYGFVIDDLQFEEVWSPPRNCTGDEPIDADALPKLLNLPKTPTKDEPAPEEQSEPFPENAPISVQEQPTAVSFSWSVPYAYARS